MAGRQWAVYCGDVIDVLGKLPDQSFNCVVTSPPYYWQRDYGVEGQFGLEWAIEDYISNIADTMDAVKSTLTKNGTLFLNLGDTYYSGKGQPRGDDQKNSARRFGLRAVDASGFGVPRKTTLGIPWRVALEMINRGWTLRSPIIWKRPGSLPEPTARDRPWRTYEHVFLFAKSPRYYFSRAELGCDEDIWEIPARPRRGPHSAAFPDELVEKCLRVGCPETGSVLDPFAGSGTVLRVALETGREASGIDIKPAYCEYIAETLSQL